MNQKFQLKSVASHIQKLYKGKSAILSEFEKNFFLWISDLCKDVKVITQNMLIRRIKLIVKEKNE